MDLIKTETVRSGRHRIEPALRVAASAILPGLILILRPLGMSWTQGAVAALLCLVIIWWCTGLVNKTIASIILIVGFLAAGAPLRTTLSFPLSQTFLFIALTYLFSRGISNAGVAKRYLQPILDRWGNTPARSILFGAAMLLITIYAIPQPLARLIIIADIVEEYVDGTDASPSQKSVILFGLFISYIFINMLTMNADIILNTTSVAVAGIEMRDLEWSACMAVPSALFFAAAMVLFFLLFRKDMKGGPFRITDSGRREARVSDQERRRDRATLALVAMTVVLWLTEPLHGIPGWVVTLCSIGVMFPLGDLRPRDIKAIDIQMLVFLTAAMSVGGVMSATGIAELVFSRLRSLIDGGSVGTVVLAVVLITVCMHMFLGSNTTTISVVIPGVVYMCSDTLPVRSVMFIVYVASTAQWLFPFHSVGLMMGASKNYFDTKRILTMGLPLTLLMLAAVFGLYLPWWRLIGLLP